MKNKLNFIYLGDGVGYINPTLIVSIRKEYRLMRNYGLTLALVRIIFCNGSSVVGIFRHSATTADHPNFQLDIDNLEEALGDFDFYLGENFDLAEADQHPAYMLEDMADYIKFHGDIVDSKHF